MNEWNQLAEISTSTRRYLAKPEVRRINEDAAAKMGRIERAKRRHTSYTTAGELDGYERERPPELPPPRDPYAFELPGDDGPPHYHSNRTGTVPTPNYSQISSQDKFTVLSPDDMPSTPKDNLPRRSTEHHHQLDNPRISDSSIVPSPRRSHETHMRPEPPPLPPKTPIQYHDSRDDGRHPLSPRGPGAAALPYPDSDGPPPVVNLARKPEFVGR